MAKKYHKRSDKDGRIGMFDGVKYLFTHRNPNSGEIYGESLSDDKAGWFNPDKIQFED